MTIKVVRGLVQRDKSENVHDAKAQVKLQRDAATSSGRVVSSDAAVSNVRLAKVPESVDRVRDPKEARRLAENVTELIREREESVEEHHKLTPVYAREHFLSQ